MRPVRSAIRASLESSTAAASPEPRSSAPAMALSPGARSTPIFSSPGPRLRNAIPSANASTSGKPNTQKIASGSR